MDAFKRKVDYEKEQMRSSGRQVMHQNAGLDDGYYGAQYIYGNENLAQTANMNQNNQMMGMAMQQNALSMPADDQNTNYYQEYCRLFIANVVLTTQMKELVAEKNELLSKLSKLEQRQSEMALKSPSLGGDSESKKKRERRRACEIDRHYTCPIEKCQKSYGSEGSLNQHVKNKHPELANNPEFRMNSLKKDGNESPNKKGYSDLNSSMEK